MTWSLWCHHQDLPHHIAHQAAALKPHCPLDRIPLLRKYFNFSPSILLVGWSSFFFQKRIENSAKVCRGKRTRPTSTRIMKQALALAVLLHWGVHYSLGFAPPLFLAAPRSNSALHEAVNGKANGKANGDVNGKANGKVNGKVNGDAKSKMNGDAKAKSKAKSEAEVNRAKLTSSEEWLDAAVKSTLEKGGFDKSSFLVGILGDLHIDPRKMNEYEEGHDHWVPIFQRAKEAHGNVALVSLGDLGESKNCGQNPSNPAELFAGTSICHTMAAEFLGSFDVPYEVIGGNHDLEGMSFCVFCHIVASKEPSSLICMQELTSLGRIKKIWSSS
jgi:hypothetical protein